jgi:prepilin-type N-terminal cleavage/methylation domain-containing protein
MKGFAKRGSRGEKGFTLVELLIVFTLLGVLAAIMIPNVSNLIGYGHTQAADAELSIIQTAMDSMMAKQNVSTVNTTGATSDMAAFPADPVAPVEALYPNYLRDDTAKGTYSCDPTGLVTRETTGYE